MTTQRMKILEHLQNTRTHPSAQEVYEYVKEELPSITLATVYRNLNLLAEQNIIIKLWIDGKWRFDGHKGLHQHAIDTRTGEIIDVKDEKLAEKIVRTAKIKDFETDSVRITFLGKRTKR